MKVLLFDVDGVLVQPVGYRRAMQAVFRHFSAGWGWQVPPPTEDDVAFYEALGLTSEWDITPLHLVAVWEAWACRYGTPPPDALARAEALPPPPTPIDYRTPAQRVAARLPAERYPTDWALHLQRTAPGDERPFPCLGAHGLVEALLSHSRDVRRNPVTRLFQEFALGSQAFATTYGLPPVMDEAPYLQRYDRPLLHASWAAALRRAVAAGEVAAAAYTARPSGPPRGVPPAPGYAPEAEMALEVVGLPDLPLIGFGRLAYFAERNARSRGQALLKPAPFHALSAIFAALLRDEQAALERASRWLWHNQPVLDGLPPEMEVLGFEDSVAGLKGMFAAVSALQEAGLAVAFRPFGVSQHPEKAQALAAQGAQVVPTVNEGLALVWER